MTKSDEKKKPDLRDQIYGREDLGAQDRHSVLERDRSPDEGDPDVTRPGPSSSHVPEGQTTKGGI